MVKRFCVTGANGFIGKQLVKFLLEKGHHVTALVRNRPAAAIQREDLNYQIVPDLRDMNVDQWKAILQQGRIFGAGVITGFGSGFCA